MPKVVQDIELQQRLIRFLKDKKLSTAQAAKEFGVDRASLWRFSKSGKAIESVKARYREALERATSSLSETEEDVALKEDVMQPLSLDGRELQRIRQACECVLKLLDAYERR